MTFREKDLYLAAYRGDVVEVTKCLESGISANCKPFVNQAPLHVAENKEVADILIRNGADVNNRDFELHQTPLHLTKNKEVAEILIQNGADVNSIDKYNKTPLHSTDTKEVAEILIENGVDVNSRDNNNQTPLHLTNNKEVAELLIQNGANVNSRDNNNDTPLHGAAYRGLEFTMKCLVRMGADITARNKENQTPLHVAENKEVAGILVKNGADVNNRDSQNQTPLHLTKTKEVAEIFIQHGADVNSRDNNNQTPLHLTKTKEVADIFIQHGADVNSRDNNNTTPLHLTENKEVAELLIQNGADVNSRDKNNQTPIDVIKKCAGTVILVKNGANVNTRYSNGDTPLHHAVKYGVLGTVKELIRLGADITASNNKGLTPLDCTKERDEKYVHTHQEVLDCTKGLNVTSRQTVENSKNKSRDTSSRSDFSITGQTKDKMEFPWIGNPSEFKVILSKGMYQSFDNRVFLAGACNCGKSTLASILIGDDIPLTWQSTNGLVVYFGRNGIHLKTGEMVPLKDDSGGHAVFSRILRGQPNILQTKRKSSEKTSKSGVRNFARKIKNAVRSIRSEAVNEVKKETLPVPDQTVTRPFTSGPEMKNKEIVHTAEECRRVESNDKPDVSKLDHYTVRKDILEEVRKGRYMIEVAPSDLVDFGGQRSYDMTHQLFIQHRGSFIIMFNGRYELTTPLMEYPQGDVTSESLIMHWINSILAYCPEGDDIMPMVLFAATHSDYFTSEEARIRKIYFTREITNLFREHEQRKHMFLDAVYFINGTNKHDPEIKALTQQLVRFAMQQSTWGQKRPMSWVPLELQIDKMRSQNSNIITRNQLEYINRLNEDLALTDKQLEDFLQNQHTIGKVMYYKQPGLEGFIIIHTPALVNIMRSFITDEMFWPDNAELKEILQNLVLTGNIYKSNLWKLWRQDSFNQYLPTDELKAFVTKLLIHLDILIQPKGHDSASGDERFLVPCMVNKSPPPDFFLRGTSDSNAIVLTYSLAISSIPSALSFKVIGAATNNLLLKEENGKQCLFHKAAIFMVDDDNEIRMCLEDNRVMVNLVNRKSLQFLSPDIAASIQECLTKTLESSIAFYYRSNGKQIDPKEVSNKMTIEVGVVCNNSVCLLHLNDASQGTEWTCTTGNRNHKKKYPMYWFFDRKQKECHQRCTGLGTTELKTIPSNRHLIRLASKFEISLFGEFIIHMGLETQEYRNIQHQYEANGVHSVMFLAMVKCMKDIEAKLKRPSLKPIRDALIAVDLNHHFLCQIFREDTSMNDVSEIHLQSPVDDDVLTELPKHIGNCVIHLGIELGLTVEDIEASMYNNPKDMYSQIASVLSKWKTSSKTPTVFALMKALQHVKSGGLSYLCQRYNVCAQD